MPARRMELFSNDFVLGRAYHEFFQVSRFEICQVGKIAFVETIFGKAGHVGGEGRQIAFENRVRGFYRVTAFVRTVTEKIYFVVVEQPCE